MTWEKYECPVFFADERYAVYNNSLINYHFIILSLSPPHGASNILQPFRKYSFISTLYSSSCCPNTFLSAVFLYLMPGINFASYKQWLSLIFRLCFFINTIRCNVREHLFFSKITFLFHVSFSPTLHGKIPNSQISLSPFFQLKRRNQ